MSFEKKSFYADNKEAITQIDIMQAERRIKNSGATLQKCHDRAQEFLSTFQAQPIYKRAMAEGWDARLARLVTACAEYHYCLVEKALGNLSNVPCRIYQCLPGVPKWAPDVIKAMQEAQGVDSWPVIEIDERIITYWTTLPETPNNWKGMDRQ